MRQRRMCVTMRMGLTRRHTRRMFVLMMFVVYVTMLMHKRLVGVSMCVTIGRNPTVPPTMSAAATPYAAVMGSPGTTMATISSRERCRGEQGRFAGCARSRSA